MGITLKTPEQEIIKTQEHHQANHLVFPGFYDLMIP